MNPQTSIPFIGGPKDGHRVSNYKPDPFVRVAVVRRPAEFPESDEGSVEFTQYELRGHTDARLYAPVGSDFTDLTRTLLDKYPTPPDPTTVRVPVHHLEAVLRSAGPGVDSRSWLRLQHILDDHFDHTAEACHPPA